MTCTLCSLDSGDAAFCCAGCENVYAILRESGVVADGQSFRDTELFQRSLRLGLVSRREEQPEPIPAGAETREAVYHVRGMWCASCGWLIEHALTRTRGMRSAEVLFASDLLKVRYCPQYLPPDRIVERVDSLGYHASEYSGPSTAGDAERKDLLLRTGIAAFLSMNAMMFSLVVYASYFEKITGFGRYIPFVLMAIATPSVFYCGMPVLRIAWKGARLGVLRMETLLAMGILSAYGYSVALALSGSTHVYFDTACAIVTLVLAGKMIERGAKEKTARGLTLLYRLMPTKVRLLADGAERFVSLEALRTGAHFRVKSGERIPADGVVVEGRSQADESVLTGESAPRPKVPGDVVICGSVNTGGVLEIRATRVGSDSTLARIVRTVEQASASRTQVERVVDRTAGIFVPAVLALATLTFAGWQWFAGNPAGALMHAIAVLVIACPCALGIATPLALTAAVAGASRCGVLVSDTRVLESIRKVTTVVLDKTGTATAGDFSLLGANGDTSRMAELAAVEELSEHPLGKIVAERYGNGLKASDVTIHPGKGISGVVGGIRYFIGNRRMVGAEITPVDAGTMVYFGWDGTTRGTMTFGDHLRPDAVELCWELRERGVRTLVLSGDSEASTLAVAKAIRADDWKAEATPDEKVAVIRELQQRGEVVAMVGDGVNDAPSLAQADLGIALGSGADIAIQAAPLVLMGASLAAVTDTLDLARRTFRIIRQNLFWAFAYNVVGIAMAVTGVLNPILSAAAMVLSSLSVIGNSRRLG